MDNVTTALVEIADDIATASDASVGRAATVVEVDGVSVRVKFADEDVAGETWFPSSVANLPVDTWGTVEPLRGNAGYFVPIGIPYINPAHYMDNTELASVLATYATDAEVATLLAAYGYTPVRAKDKSAGDQSIGSAGDYLFKLGTDDTVARIALTGLVGSATYSLDVDMTMRITGAAGTSGQIGYVVNGGTNITEVYGLLIAWVAGGNWMTWSWETEVAATAGGAINVTPMTRWGNGTYTPTYCTIRVKATRIS